MIRLVFKQLQLVIKILLILREKILIARPLIVTCGGYTVSCWCQTDSCLVLNPAPNSQHWEERRLGSMTMPRHHSAAARLNHIGVYIIGGELPTNRRTSEFLAAGAMQWQEGPVLPVDMAFPCAVQITTTSFLARVDI